MSDITVQQAFDKVYEYFVTEKHEPSMIGARCRLRSQPRNVKSPCCAVGLFVKDYIEEMEEMGITKLVREGYLPKIIFETKVDQGCDIAFWDAIQQAHDISSARVDFREGMISELHTIAMQYDLKESYE